MLYCKASDPNNTKKMDCDVLTIENKQKNKLDFILVGTGPSDDLLSGCSLQFNSVLLYSQAIFQFKSTVSRSQKSQVRTNILWGHLCSLYPLRGLGLLPQLCFCE